MTSMARMIALTVFLSMVSLWDRVETAGMKRVAFEDPLKRHPGARQGAFFPEGFFGIRGTSWSKAAAGSQGGRKTGAVKSDKEDQNLFHVQAPAFLKSLTRSSSAAEKAGRFMA